MNRSSFRVSSVNLQGLWFFLCAKNQCWLYDLDETLTLSFRYWTLSFIYDTFIFWSWDLSQRSCVRTTQQFPITCFQFHCEFLFQCEQQEDATAITSWIDMLRNETVSFYKNNSKPRLSSSRVVYRHVSLGRHCFYCNSDYLRYMFDVVSDGIKQLQQVSLTSLSSIQINFSKPFFFTVGTVTSARKLQQP